MATSAQIGRVRAEAIPTCGKMRPSRYWAVTPAGEVSKLLLVDIHLRSRVGVCTEAGITVTEVRLLSSKEKESTAQRIHWGVGTQDSK